MLRAPFSRALGAIGKPEKEQAMVAGAGKIGEIECRPIAAADNIADRKGKPRRPTFWCCMPSMAFIPVEAGPCIDDAPSLRLSYCETRGWNDPPKSRLPSQAKS